MRVEEGGRVGGFAVWNAVEGMVVVMWLEVVGLCG